MTTGVAADLAHFQARSAFTGVGFTTSESESVATHPARRRIILAPMLLGNAGIVSVIASLVVGFVGASSRTAALRLLVLAGGLLGLWLLARTRWFNRMVSRAIEFGLRRWTELDVRDYVQLLDVSGDYAVRDQPVQEGDWLVGTVLRDLDLTSEGVLVLGIRRANGQFVGAPAPTPRSATATRWSCTGGRRACRSWRTVPAARPATPNTPGASTARNRSR